MPYCWVSANQDDMCLPAPAAVSGLRCVRLVSQIRKAVEFHDVRLSMTRFALPSLGVRERASTSATRHGFQHMIERALERHATLQCSDFIVEHLGVTSTCTSI